MIAWLLLACDPYARWPEPTAVFPYGVSPDPDRPDYVDARVETETWTPLVDPERTAQYIEKSLKHYPGAPADVRLHFAEHRARLLPLVAAPVQLDFAGDILPVAGRPLEMSSLALSVAPLFDGDVAIANLETPTAPDFEAPGLYAFNTDPALHDSLPFDVLQLNNNHSLDAGLGGLLQTAAEVRRRGMTPVGAGEHVLLGVGTTQVALLSYTWGLNVAPDPDAPFVPELFVVPFGHLGPVDLTRVRQDIRAARERGADLVVVMPHWGYEYEYYPDPHFLILGRELVAAGADLVVGTGPHVAQPAEICAVDQPRQPPGRGACSVRTDEDRPRTAAILYSLGNFSSTPLTVPTEVGVVASVGLDPELGVTGIGWQAIATVSTDDGPRVVPLSALLDDPAYAAEAARLDAHLGARWRR